MNWVKSELTYEKIKKLEDAAKKLKQEWFKDKPSSNIITTPSVSKFKGKKYEGKLKKSTADEFFKMLSDKEIIATTKYTNKKTLEDFIQSKGYELDDIEIVRLMKIFISLR